MKKLSVLMLSLLLLTGCQPQAAESPAPSLEVPPTSQVTVHWDALEPREPKGTLADRWYGEYTGDLIPSGEYGELVPYIGGESQALGWGSGWYYGLATRDGTIVTDPVFLRAYAPGYTDPTDYEYFYLPMWVLSRPGQNEAGNSMEHIGLAAPDGSWYTGLVYHSILGATSLGMLMVEPGGDVTLVSPDGTQTHMWDAEDVPLTNYHYDEEYSSAWWNGEFTSSFGHWWQVENGWNDDGFYSYRYIDLSTGQYTDTQPDGFPPEPEYREGVGTFDAGWFERADDTLTIHTNDGQTHVIDISGYTPYYQVINGDRVIFQRKEALDPLRTYVLTDLDGNILCECEDYLSFLGWNTPGALLYYTPFLYSYYNQDMIVLDRNGNYLLTAQYSSITQRNGLLTFVDDSWYRMTDLEGNDLIRLPRLSFDD